MLQTKSGGDLLSCITKGSSLNKSKCCLLLCYVIRTRVVRAGHVKPVGANLLLTSHFVKGRVQHEGGWRKKYARKLTQIRKQECKISQVTTSL